MLTTFFRSRAGRPGRVTALRLTLLLALLSPAAAHAHGALRRAVPASNARLTAAPRELRLTFNERVELAVARVTLAGPGGAPVALSPLAAAPDSAHVVVAAIRGGLAAGAYTVTWQVAGRDGHPVRGRYTFTLLPGAARPGATGLASATPTDPRPTAAPAPGEAAAGITAPGQMPPPATHHVATSPPTAQDFGAESAGYVVVRGLTYLALLVVIGAVAFRFAVLGVLGRRPSGDGGTFGHDLAHLVPAAGRGTAALGFAGAVALAGAALARLYAQSLAMHGAEGARDAVLVGTMLRRTVWGWGWLLQVAAALLAAAGFAAARREEARRRTGSAVRRGAGGGWALAGLAALALALTPALSGHAAAAPQFAPLVVAADALHVLGAGGWLGGLVALVAAGLPAARTLEGPGGAGRRVRAVAALVHAFSPAALGFAGLLTLTGLLATWVHVGAVPALWGTAYGRTLLLKLGVLAVVAGAGAYNWRRVRPALADPRDDGRGVERLRRSSAVELAAGLATVAVTAALVATPTPADAPDVQAGPVRAGAGVGSGTGAGATAHHATR